MANRCAAYLLWRAQSKILYVVLYATLVIFAVMPLGVAIGFCDLFYALMAFPTMITILLPQRSHARK